AFGRPVARGAGAVLLAGDQDLRRVLLLVAHRRIVDRHGLVGAIVVGEATLDARHHLVLEANVGEGATHHHLVIAASRAVLVEVLGRDVVLFQILPSRAVLLA